MARYEELRDRAKAVHDEFSGGSSHNLKKRDRNRDLLLQLLPPPQQLWLHQTDMPSGRWRKGASLSQRLCTASPLRVPSFLFSTVITCGMRGRPFVCKHSVRPTDHQQSQAGPAEKPLHPDPGEAEEEGHQDRAGGGATESRQQRGHAGGRAAHPGRVCCPLQRPLCLLPHAHPLRGQQQVQRRLGRAGPRWRGGTGFCYRRERKVPAATTSIPAASIPAVGPLGSAFLDQWFCMIRVAWPPVSSSQATEEGQQRPLPPLALLSHTHSREITDCQALF